MRFKVGDNVRVRKDLIVKEEYGDCYFMHEMASLKGKIVTIEKICDNRRYRIKEMNWIWTDEMLEEINEDKMEKTFEEIMLSEENDEVWENEDLIIEKYDDEIAIAWKDGQLNCGVVVPRNTKFKFKRKEYTFEEAFKAYEEGKEIEDYLGTKYKKIDGVDCCKDEYSVNFCTKSDEDDYWFGFDEIRNKWYIND